MSCVIHLGIGPNVKFRNTDEGMFGMKSMFLFSNCRSAVGVVLKLLLARHKISIPFHLKYD